MANHRDAFQPERRLSTTPSYVRQVRPPIPASPLQRLMLVAVAAVALAVLALALRMLDAALAENHTEQYLQHWQRHAREPAPQAWQAAFTAARRAVDSYPVASGRYLDRLGQVQAWRYPQQPVGAAQAAESRRAALDAYRDALAARPTWPNTWARVAHTYYALGETSAAFAQALEQANRLGPYRPAVQGELASVGLRTWPQLSAAQRVTTLESAHRVLDGHTDAARDLLDLAQSLGLQDVLCHGAPPQAAALCKHRGIRI